MNLVRAFVVSVFVLSVCSLVCGLDVSECPENAYACNSNNTVVYVSWQATSSNTTVNQLPNDDFPVDIGVPITLTASVQVYYFGVLVCEEVVQEPANTISPAGYTFYSSSYQNIAVGTANIGFPTNTNPVTFALFRSGTYGLSITGYACVNYWADQPVTVTGNIIVNSLSVDSFSGSCPPKPGFFVQDKDMFFLWQDPTSAQVCQLSANGIQNVLAVPVNLGILQIVSVCQVYMQLSDGTQRVFENFQSALDPANDGGTWVTMGPTATATPGQAVNLQLPDGPGIQIVNCWVQAEGEPQLQIVQYTTHYSFQTHLMAQTAEGSAQWTVIAPYLSWEIKGELDWDATAGGWTVNDANSNVINQPTPTAQVMPTWADYAPNLVSVAIDPTSGCYTPKL